MSMGGAVLELFAKLTLDSSDFDKKLGAQKDKASGFASFLKTAGAIGTAAFTAIGTATAIMGEQAINAFKNYEQLSGGIEKLFGSEGAAIVAEYAQNAFMTSGKSINEYYNSVSQITASLKRSIGDDMAEVARVADVAMQVISDNVNTFGSDAEFVENAIMGLSRQNYTMIDNLKLGYAGTAQGMLELINDSGILGKTLTDTSQLATVGFDQMILAIQKVQEEQGIAGTTAKEAMTTIEGTANATRKAWQNVLTAIGRGEGIESSIKGLSDTIFGIGLIDGKETGLLNQIIPRIETVMNGIGEFVVQAAPMIAEKIPEVANAVIPSLLKTTVQLFSMLAKFIYSQAPKMVTTGIVTLNNFINGMRNKLPDIIKFVVDMIGQIADWIVQNLPLIVNTGINLIGALIKGLVSELPHIVKVMWDLAKNAFKSFLQIDWFGLGRDVIGGIIEGIQRYGYRIAESLKDLAKRAWKGVKNFFGIESPSKLMRDTVGKFIPLGIAEGIEDAADSVYKAMDSLSVGTVGAYDSVLGEIPKFSSSENRLNYGGVTINVYAAEGMDEETLANKIMRKINTNLRKEQMIYG